jgi:hypothetical protein
MQSFVMMLAIASTWAHPPIFVELSQPTRFSSLQEVGSPFTGGCCGESTPTAQYTLFEAPHDLQATALCFVVPIGTSTRPHGLALLAPGPDGRPGQLLWYSDDIYVGPAPSSPATPGIYCAALDDVGGTVPEECCDFVNAISMNKGDALWLGFYAGTGTPAISYYTANPSTARYLGSPYPGGPRVFHLQENNFSGWTTDPSTIDVSEGYPVLVSVQFDPFVW